ncbi:hypothetical protein Tco_1054004 [Tanacetum coccineum]|uniref:Uncharacterized protein n=1 Tax=Tanacetum coccineum TaxID=301880 RepID=A0ABQ5GXD5_9ASTR
MAIACAENDTPDGCIECNMHYRRVYVVVLFRWFLELKDQLQGKDELIRKLKAQIGNLKEVSADSNLSTLEFQALETENTQLKEVLNAVRIKNDSLRDENVSIKKQKNNREANTPLPKEIEVASAKPHHMIAPDSSRWVPTGKIFTSSTTKVDSESTNGSDEDITNQYEYKQTLDVSAGTPNLSAGLRPNSMALGHNGAGPEINNLYSSNGSISVLVYGHWSREKASIQEIDTSVLGGLKGFALANTVKEVLIMNLPDHRCSTRTVIIDPHGIRGYCNRQD